MKNFVFSVGNALAYTKRYLAGHRPLAVLAGILVLLVLSCLAVESGREIGKFIYIVTH